MRDEHASHPLPDDPALAAAATAKTIRDHAIYCLRSWVAGRTDEEAAHLRLVCATALDETRGPHSRQAARELCAQQWNLRAGVLC